MENQTLRGIFHVVSRFPQHFVLYLGNLDYFLDSEIHQNLFNSVVASCTRTGLVILPAMR